MTLAPLQQAAPAALSVLIVDDSDDDALLFARMLRRSDRPIATARAGSLAEALEALERARDVCVLLDLSLPDADNLEGLRAMRARFPDVPIIVLTGRGDDVGAQALQHGAQDYLGKRSIDAEVLGRTVRYAVERMDIARQLAAAQTRFRQAFEHGPLGVALVSLEPASTGRILEANDALARILDRARDELHGVWLRDISHWEDHARAQEALDGLAAGRSASAALQMRLLQSAGDLAWVSLSMSRACADLEGSLYAVVQVEDITQRKRDEEQLREAKAALDNAVGGVSRIDLAGNYAVVNPAYAALCGAEANGLIGRDWRTTVHPADRPSAVRAYEEMLQVGRAEVEVRMLTGGEPVAAGLVLVRHVAADGALKGHFCFARDISERRRAELALAESERRYRSIVETTSEGVLVLDRDFTVRFVNRRTLELFGVAESEILGRPMLSFVEGSSRSEIDALLDRSRTAAGSGVSQLDARLHRGDGSLLWGLFSAASMADASAGTDGTLVMISDITDRKRVESELERQALRDGLTGLPNRALLMDRLTHALRRRERQNGGLAVLFLDLDRFKLANDAHGHGAGDELLKRLVPRMRSAIRAGDTLARFGGDEFVVLCDDVTSEQDAIAVAERIVAAVERPLAICGSEITLTLSVGLSTAFGGGASSAEDLIRDADTAMYRAKEQGGGRVEVYDAAMRARLLQEVSLERDLRRALDCDQLHVLFQPIVGLPSGTPVGFEALLRWEHPERGTVSPAVFVPLAERTGLIRPIGDFVLRQACRQIARWQVDHPGARWARVTVNVSAHQLATGDFAATAAKAIREHGVPADRLAFEITETALLAGTAAAGALREVKDLGVRVWLDDFGTGYSSISHLVRYPVDGVKVDRSFVAGLMGTTEASTLPIVEGIIGMAQALGLSVVAEGVETDEQLIALNQLGCCYAQGYHLARPMSAAAARDWALSQPERPSLGTPATPADHAAAITMKEAIDALGVSASTLRRWADSGRIHVVRTPGGHRRIPLEEIRRLNRERLHKGAVVARTSPSRRPLPGLARLIETDGPTIAHRVTKRLYEDTVGGFFDSEAGEALVRRWLGVLCEACGTGDYGPVLDDAGSLLRSTRLAGGTLLECQAFVERYGEVAAAIVAKSHGREQALECRRLFLALREAVVAAAE